MENKKDVLARKREAADYDLASFKSILKSLKSLRQKTDVRANYKNVFWGSPLIDQRHASQFNGSCGCFASTQVLYSSFVDV